MLNSFEFGRSGSPSYNFAADGRKILIGRYNFYEMQTKPTQITTIKQSTTSKQICK